MPRIINTRNSGYSSVYEKIKRKKFSYEYPNGLDLKPGSELHDRLRDKIIERANEANDVISARRDNWTAIEQNLTAYIPVDEDELKIIDEDDRKPVRVVVPVSYAVLETLLTYWVSAFLRDPIFRFEGYGPEDVVGAMLLERTIQQQMVHSAAGVALHTWWRDGLSAGIGAVTPIWTKTLETRVVRRKVSDGVGSLFSRVKNAFVPSEPVYEEFEVPAWEGDVIYNIDYRNLLPDPNVPIYEIHKGESAGWVRRSNYITMLEEELASDGMIFNVKYLKGESGESMLFDDNGSSGRVDKLGGSTDTIPTSNPVIDTIYMYMKIIPADEGLGDSDRPEVWLFALSADKVITQAHKIENSHGQIPIAGIAPDYDGHTLLPISRMEIIYGLQQAIDWMFDSHMANVRKAINDMLIVDPSLVNMYDLQHPGPGKLVRLRKSVWGRGVKDAVMQLPVADITRQHIGDISFLVDAIHRTSAAVDSLQGIVRRGSERRSAAEFQGTLNSALSRIEKTARLTWMQGMLPLQKMLASDTQQFMSAAQWVRINREWQERVVQDFGEGSVFETPDGKLKALVEPDRLQYNYDIVPHDGTMPGSGDPMLWAQILQTVSQNPVLLNRIDVFRVFKHLAHMAGVKNIEEFENRGGQLPAIKPEIKPDEQVAAEVQKGNLLPVGLE